MIRSPGCTDVDHRRAGTTDYVAINPMAVASVILGAASAIALLDNLLLAVPILAVIVSIISLRQIK